jgi:1-aminocyclopropane-1-carboxylate deaminase/D-cysteine desulfhydrase-like pyridoxal-dependent ACC family enzyme
MNALFGRYPRLQSVVAHAPLADLPTPIEKLAGLCRELSADGLYVKRDDLTAPVYGGNKVRKLEFILGAALRVGAKRAITTGGAGSNHALATALYAKLLGLKSALLLFAQPNATAVRKNLLVDLFIGADLHFCASYALSAERMQQLREHYRAVDGVEPFLIPGGGSSALGALGYVNAALELADQIARGEIPEPAAIYLAAGTLGTMVGLVLGLKLAGLRTKVMGVRVVPTGLASPERALGLFREVNQLLHGSDPAVALVNADETTFAIDSTWFGSEYALYTEESVNAVRLMRRVAGLELDGTYTGKACVGFLKAAREMKPGEALLFWLTKNSRPLPAEALAQDWHALPPEFHRYFTDEVQPLDRAIA